MMTVAVVTDGVRQLETLYREDGDRLWRAVLAFGGDPDLASDAVAEAFAQAIRRGDAIANAQAWVWRAAFRIAAGELKARLPTGAVLPEGSYRDPELDTELLEALTHLPIKQRAAVVLFYYADASVREIANRTGMSQLSVRANLSRGRKRLKQLLGDSHD
jgi:RNA polymerase sigma factor (sigma-70 family)